ncbi:MAG TPA: HAD family hydrolase [Symbiobacteriaceae bacterium]|nr:HAD family hydrolase [Symbiobacteriaceae bacterium]
MKAVLFDVMALLYGPVGAELVTEILASEGVHVTEAEVAEALASLPPELIAFERAMRTEEEEVDWDRARWKPLLKNLGIPYPTDALLLRLCEASFGYDAFYSLYPETLAVLHALKERGVKLGVIGNWAPSLPRLIQAFELDAFIDLVLPSSVARVAKPDGLLFRQAAGALGAPAAETIHVGPSLSLDVLGASAAGLAPVWLNRTGIETGHEVLTITDLRGLLLLSGAPA